MSNPFTRQSKENKGSTLLDKLISANTTLPSLAFQPHAQPSAQAQVQYIVCQKSKQALKENKDKEKHKENQTESKYNAIENYIGKTDSIDFDEVPNKKQEHRPSPITKDKQKE